MPRYPRESARPRLQSRTPIGAALAMGSLALATLALTAQPAQATTIVDPTGDILSTFNGPQTGPTSDPFDVSSVSATQNGVDVTISGTLAGPATAAGYVVGIDRGSGEAFLDAGPTPVGAGVLFDSVAILVPGGGSFVDLLPSNTIAPLTDVSFSGDSFTAVIPFSDLPSTGFTTGNYLYNLWPRNSLADPTDNTAISDFAPDASSFIASAPEPGSWALMLTGLGILGAALRNRRRVLTALSSVDGPCFATVKLD